MMAEEAFEDEGMEGEQEPTQREFVMEEESLAEHEMEFFEFTEDMQSPVAAENLESVSASAEGELSPEGDDSMPEEMLEVPEE